jgi:putative zinc finger protein
MTQSDLRDDFHGGPPLKCVQHDCQNLSRDIRMRDEYTNRLHQVPEYRQEQLSAALDGMLTPDEQAMLDAHLAGCATCSRELEELRQVRSLLRAMPQPALPRSFLLPTEDAVAPSHAAAVARQPDPDRAPMPIPLPARRNPGAARAVRTLRLTRRIGTVAAVIGLALFLGTLLPMLTHQNYGFSAAAPANGGSNHTQQSGDTYSTYSPMTQPAIPEATHTFTVGGPDQNKSATATVTATPALPATGSATASTPLAHTTENTGGPSLAEILRALAIALVVVGVGLALVASFIGRQF